MEELQSILEFKPTPEPRSPDPRAYDRRLQLRTHVVYIVAAVLFDGEKLLLIQEAKPSCRGMWYLPAGRMEPNETIVEAAKREVLEESGLVFEPEAVIAVECGSYQWIRFTLSGRVSGGKLKTPAEADGESLQAGWFNRKGLSEVHLRAPDILPLIDVGRKWVAMTEGRRPEVALPVEVGHVSTSFRLVILYSSGEEMLVLTARSEIDKHSTTLFPIAEISYTDSVKETIKSCGYSGDHNVKGVLSIEHLGKPWGVHDGLCLSVLVLASIKELDTNATHQWIPVDHNCREKLKQAVDKCARLFFL